MIRINEYLATALADRRFYDQLANAAFDDDLVPVLAESTAGYADVERHGLWAHAVPRNGAEDLPHGWKLHVSAVPGTAAEALRAVGEVIAADPVRFKVLRDTRLVRISCGRWWEPAQVGKVIAVYPRSPQHARELAEALDTATKGLNGPYVLSDRRYADDSCVYYRYGGHRHASGVTADGSPSFLLTGPDGRTWTDDRLPAYRCPPWVEPLFEVDETAGVPVIGGYRVLRPLQFRGTGGTYLAERVDGGGKAVLKEARPYTGFAADGSDAQERLRREYAALRTMSGSGLAPEPIELLEEWEHLFLAEEFLDGQTLVHFIAANNALVRDEPEAVAGYSGMVDGLIARLDAAVSACHERGLVFGDLSLTNVLVAPGAERLWLVDFESSRPIDGPQHDFPRTPGFSPLAGSPRYEDGYAVDRFGVAAVEAALLLPRNTLLELRPAALTASITWAAERLDRDPAPLLAALDLPEPDRVPADPAALAAEATRFIRAVMTPDRTDRLFPADPKVFSRNPWSVRHGAAGVLRALHRIDGSLPPEALEWLKAQRPRLDSAPPGLHHGLAGLGWTLLEAGHAEFGRELVERAADGDRREDAGLAGGSAGVGMACLAAWLHGGDTAFLERAHATGERLAAECADDGAGLHWPSGSGRRPIGYADGSSGVALFLTYLGSACEELRFLRLARRALAADLAEVVELDTGRYGVPARAGEEVYYPYWQYGSAGLVSVLVRYCAAVEDEALREYTALLAERNIGGVSVSPALFTGTAGIANTAMDYARFSGDERYVARAVRLCEAMAVPACAEPEGAAFPGEGLLRYSTDYATGSAGIALTLHRLGTGGPDFNYTLDALLGPRTECLR